MKNDSFSFFKRVCLAVIFCLGFGFFNPALAYIDPGFGSMMLSVCIGVLTTLYFLFHSFLIYIKRFFKKKLELSSSSLSYVIYSDGKQYFNVFKPIIDEFEKRGIPLAFYTSSKDDPFFENEYKFVKGKYIGKNNEAYFNLAFLRADICIMTTPQLDVLQLKRSKFTKKYIHIFHGITTSMDYKLFSLDYYDCVMCDGEFQIPLIRELEEKRNLNKKDLVVVGSTYMDVLAQKLNNLQIEKDENFTILIAPSWGENSIFKKYPNVIEKLAQTNWKIIIRPHPQSLLSEEKMISEFREKYKNNSNISWDFNNENLEAMAKSDILITDYSTIMFDYAFLFEKPFLYMLQDFNKEILDISDIKGNIWRYEVMKKIGREITSNNMDSIVSIVEELSENEEIREEIKKAKEIAWQNKGEAGKRAVDFILQKHKEIS